MWGDDDDGGGGDDDDAVVVMRLQGVWTVTANDERASHDDNYGT